MVDKKENNIITILWEKYNSLDVLVNRQQAIEYLKDELFFL
jgi:hypothetical protein